MSNPLFSRSRLVAGCCALLVVGALSACGHHGSDARDHADRDSPRATHRDPSRHGHEGAPGGPFGWGEPPHGQPRSAEDTARMREQFTRRLTRDLQLDAAQQARLNALADALDQQHKQREALRPAGGNAQGPQRWIQGAKFDRAAAKAELDARAAAMQAGEPAVLAAAADFYDGLTPEQQDKVRTFLNRRNEPGRNPVRGSDPGQRGRDSERGPDRR